MVMPPDVAAAKVNVVLPLCAFWAWMASSVRAVGGIATGAPADGFPLLSIPGVEKLA
jgi:hypothetical protein